MTDIPATRICTKCGEEKPLTLEFWGRHKCSSFGFRRHCKVCCRAYKRAWKASHREEVRAESRSYYHNNKSKFRENARKESRRAQKAQYQREYVKANSERIRSYRQSETGRLIAKKYRQSEVGRIANKVKTHRRRARKLVLVDTWTNQQWSECLEYFNGCCAVCGRQLKDLFSTHTAAADHWIPVDSPDCPGTVVWNIVPLCHSRKVGAGGCNNSKHNKLPADWLSLHYKPAQVKAIMKRVNDYFEWVKRQRDDEQSA